MIYSFFLTLNGFTQGNLNMYYLKSQMKAALGKKNSLKIKEKLYHPKYSFCVCDTVSVHLREEKSFQLIFNCLHSCFFSQCKKKNQNVE